MGADLDEATVELATANKQIAALEKTNATQATTIATLNKQFFSPRQKAIFWWIIGAWLGLGVAGICLSIFVPGVGLTIGTEILHLLPVSNPFGWVLSWLQSRSTPKPVVTPA